MGRKDRNKGKKFEHWDSTTEHVTPEQSGKAKQNPAVRVFTGICVAIVFALHLARLFIPAESPTYEFEPEITAEMVQEFQEMQMASMFDSPEIQELIAEAEAIRDGGETE